MISSSIYHLVIARDTYSESGRVDVITLVSTSVERSRFVSTDVRRVRSELGDEEAEAEAEAVMLGIAIDEVQVVSSLESF